MVIGTGAKLRLTRSCLYVQCLAGSLPRFQAGTWLLSQQAPKSCSEEMAEIITLLAGPDIFVSLWTINQRIKGGWFGRCQELHKSCAWPLQNNKQLHREMQHCRLLRSSMAGHFRCVLFPSASHYLRMLASDIILNEAVNFPSLYFQQQSSSTVAPNKVHFEWGVFLLSHNLIKMISCHRV